MKQLTVAGRLGRDAEMKQTNGGTLICKFSIAVDSRRGQEKTTTWFDVAIFGRRGEALCPHLRKGSSVVVTGDLEARTYEAKDGDTRLALGVVASEITLLGGRPDQSPEQRSGGTYDRAPHGGQGGSAGDDGWADDLPF